MTHEALAGIAIAIDAMLDGRIAPHDLPGPLHDLWRDGFRAGQEALQPRLTRAEAAADRYYYLAFNAPQARAQHERMLRDFTVAQARRDTTERWAELDEVAASRASAARA